MEIKKFKVFVIKKVVKRMSYLFLLFINFIYIQFVLFLGLITMDENGAIPPVTANVVMLLILKSIQATSGLIKHAAVEVLVDKQKLLYKNY